MSYQISRLSIFNTAPLSCSGNSHHLLNIDGGKKRITAYDAATGKVFFSTTSPDATPLNELTVVPLKSGDTPSFAFSTQPKEVDLHVGPDGAWFAREDGDYIVSWKAAPRQTGTIDSRRRVWWQSRTAPRREMGPAVGTEVGTAIHISHYDVTRAAQQIVRNGRDLCGQLFLYDIHYVALCQQDGDNLKVTFEQGDGPGRLETSLFTSAPVAALAHHGDMVYIYTADGVLHQVSLTDESVVSAPCAAQDRISNLTTDRATCELVVHEEGGELFVSALNRTLDNGYLAQWKFRAGQSPRIVRTSLNRQGIPWALPQPGVEIWNRSQTHFNTVVAHDGALPPRNLANLGTEIGVPIFFGAIGLVALGLLYRANPTYIKPIAITAVIATVSTFGVRTTLKHRGSVDSTAEILGMVMGLSIGSLGFAYIGLDAVLYLLQNPWERLMGIYKFAGASEAFSRLYAALLTGLSLAGLITMTDPLTDWLSEKAVSVIGDGRPPLYETFGA